MGYDWKGRAIFFEKGVLGMGESSEVVGCAGVGESGGLNNGAVSGAAGLNNAMSVRANVNDCDVVSSDLAAETSMDVDHWKTAVLDVDSFKGRWKDW